MRFYKYPFIDVLIATDPAEVISDLRKVGAGKVKDKASAARFLQLLVDRIRSIGVQLFLYIEEVEFALPEIGRVSTAIISLENRDKVYYTPPTGSQYSFEKLQRLVGGNI